MTLTLTVNETLKWLACRSHSGSDSVAIDNYIYNLSFPPSLIKLTVSVDVRHHVYLLTYKGRGQTVSFGKSEGMGESSLH